MHPASCDSDLYLRHDVNVAPLLERERQWRLRGVRSSFSTAVLDFDLVALLTFAVPASDWSRPCVTLRDADPTLSLLLSKNHASLDSVEFVRIDVTAKTRGISSNCTIVECPQANSLSSQSSISSSFLKKAELLCAARFVRADVHLPSAALHSSP